MTKLLSFFKNRVPEDGFEPVNQVSFGLASGLMLGLLMIVYSLLASLTGYGIEIETMLEDLLPGYTLTIPGAIVGVVWVFSIGYIYGSLFSWTYNKLVKNG